MKFKLCLLLLLSYASVVLAQPTGNYYRYNDTSKRISRSVLRTTATEVCNNNIDDDNNGLTDDKDFACYFNGLTATTCKSNSVIWSVGGNSDLYWFDLSTGVQHVVGKTPIPLLDLTWAANGKLYGLGPFPPYIYEIDPNTAAVAPITNPPAGYVPGNSMTADAAGNLYLSCSSVTDPFLILRFNVTTGATCVVGNLSGRGIFAAGDLTFLNGMLYQSCSSTSLARINISSGDVTVQTFTGANASDFFGIVGMSDGYFYAARGTGIYQIDPVTLAVAANPVIQLSDRAMASFGLAAYNELCQAPACLGKTSIQAAGSPPYCNTMGVLLKGSVTYTNCNQNVNITGISWTTANNTIVPGNQVRALAPGKYYLNYTTTTETCNRMDSFTLQYPPNPPLAVDTSYQLPVGCNCNGSITVIAGCGSGNYQYNWSTGATTATINNVCPGTYNVKVTDVVSRNDTTVWIIIPAPPNGISGFYTITMGDHCNQGDGSLTISTILGGSAPYQYAINNQPFGRVPNFTSLPAGNYTATVKDAGNCALQQLVTIPALAAPQQLNYTKQDAYCGLLTGTITIASVKDGSPPYTFSVNNGPFTPQTTLANVLPGQGSITVKDNYGCTLNESFTIFQSEQLRIALSPKDTTICASQPVTFTATVLSNSAGVYYSWNQVYSNNNNVYTTSFLDNSKMIVEATDNTGCTAYDSATITAPYCDSIFARCVLFPNAFSPNNDGLNDTFGPHLGGCNLKSYQLSVYNRWGQLIFQTRDQSKRWNGGTNGQTPQTGTYIYTCAWQDAVGHYHNHKGAVVLVR